MVARSIHARARQVPSSAVAIGLGVRRPQLQPQAWPARIGRQHAALRIQCPIEQHPPDPLVIMEVSQVPQVGHGHGDLGFPAYGIRHPGPFMDYTGIATANGALGLKVTHPGEVRDAISQALSHDGPALVNVNVNPDEPPLPGKVEYKQAVKFPQAFPRGQPRKSTIATTLFRDKIDQLRS